MSVEDQKAMVRRLFEEGVNRRNYDVIDELIAPDFILHSVILGDLHGAAAYKQSVQALLDPCPDFRATVEETIGGENDTVIARVTYRGTDTGGFVQGHPPTGRRFEFTAMYIWRVANGMVAELYQEADRARLLQQLGVLS